MQASPNRIGKYELISRLGRGGMGEVYKGFHPQLQRFVAIKVLLTNSETDPEFIQRFQNEALAVARLRHPHIVQVFDFDIADGKPYMVMEFVEGETLAQRIARYHQAGQIMPTAEAVRLVQQLCSAVDYAHKQGMLHRDIKPANVLITPQGEAILTDFGLAKISGVSGLTASGSIMGTPHYMSPEQGQGQPVDARSDVYSLSVILYELLAGKRPFEADTPVRVMMQHVTQPPTPIEQANPAVPRALAQVALVGMAKNPDERFRSAAALGAAISAALKTSPASDTDLVPTRLDYKPDMPAGQPVRGNVSPPPPAIAGRPPAGGQLVDLAAHAPGAEPPRRKPSNQLSRYLVIGIILLLIVIGGGILLIALGNKTPSQTGNTTASGSVGAVTFTDSDPNDFSHPANTLQATFSNLQQPAGGATDFAWLCASGSTTCTLLGAVLVQHNGSATLNHTQSDNLLGVSNPANLATGLTFEITKEQTEPSSPPTQPSTTIVYSGQIQSNVLLHIRHQLAAFPGKGALFPNNTTALDTGLGVDATLLNQLAQRLLTPHTLGTQQELAEEMLNLIAGKDGQQDWNQDGRISLVQGDDGFGLGASATVGDDCSGPQNTAYLDLTMQHACLAAKASGAASLANLFTKIKKAGANIAADIASMQPILQKIAQATNSSAFSQGDLNTLAQTASAILNGVTGETSQQDGARQILLYSEAMATITINPA